MNSINSFINGNTVNKISRTSGFQKQWKLIRKNKFIFLASIIICIAIAFLISRYTEPVYIVSSTISVSEKNVNNNPGKLLVKDEDQSSINSSSGIDKLQEIALLTSVPFIEKTIRALDFRVSYFRKDKIGNTELYGDSPFFISFPDTALASNIDGQQFEIVFKSNQTFLIQGEGSNDLNLYNVGKAVVVNGCPIVVNGTSDFRSARDIGKPYSFKKEEVSTLAFYFKNSLEVISDDEESGIMQISLQTPTPKKGVDFLNELTRQYIKDKYEEKSRSAAQALVFINEQINTVKNALGGTESSLASFKAANTFSDPNSMTERNLNALAEVQNETFALRQQENYYSSLLNDLNSNTGVDQLVSPSSVGIQDAATSNLMKELSDLQTQKNSYAASGDSKNPYLQDIELKINAGKRALRASISRLQNTNRSRLSQLNSRAGQFQSNVYRIPPAEKQFTDINRARDFNDALYQFLMQKRVEAGIMKASATVEDKIIEPPFFSTVPLEPKPTRNYIFALLIGFLLPLGYLKIRTALNKQIGEKEEIQDSTSIPIIGSIYHNLDTSALVIKHNSRTAVSESFRIFRYNLTQFAKGSSKKIILFTSTKSGEGKSFSSINVALSFAIAKKKTILINLDLRLPSKSYEELTNSNAIGISSFLNDNASLKDIIQRTDNPYLDYIATGELPSNPAELLMEGSKLENLLTQLKTVYDYIIIDTPPLGVVADPLIISSYSDVNVLVVREKYTLKENLFELEDMYKEGKIKDVVMLINDVRLDNKGYKNAYYYKK